MIQRIGTIISSIWTHNLSLIKFGLHFLECIFIASSILKIVIIIILICIEWFKLFARTAWALNKLAPIVLSRLFAVRFIYTCLEVDCLSLIVNRSLISNGACFLESVCATTPANNIVWSLFFDHFIKVLRKVTICIGLFGLLRGRVVLDLINVRSMSVFHVILIF